MTADPLRVALPSTLRWTGEPAVFDPQRPNWQAQGACLGADPDLFFPERNGDVRPAKAICATCPVKRECLDYALETRQMFGIWGGLSEKQRKALRPRRRTNGELVQEEIA